MDSKGFLQKKILVTNVHVGEFRYYLRNASGISKEVYYHIAKAKTEGNMGQLNQETLHKRYKKMFSDKFVES